MKGWRECVVWQPTNPPPPPTPRVEVRQLVSDINVVVVYSSLDSICVDVFRIADSAWWRLRIEGFFFRLTFMVHFAYSCANTTSFDVCVCVCVCVGRGCLGALRGSSFLFIWKCMQAYLAACSCFFSRYLESNPFLFSSSPLLLSSTAIH